MRLLPLFLLCLFHPDSAGAQQGGRPFTLKLGDAVVTGFSGTVRSEPAQPAARNRAPNDFTFINPDGPSVRVIDVSRPGYVWDGRLFAAPKTFDVFAKDVGQVFGVALDDSAQPNIYVAATSVFGLNIVVRGRDGKPERRKKGAPGAGWMKGQFGLDLQGGPGSIYKIDGRTGVPMLFANVTLNGVPNPGPGLGNLAYDSAHKQLFVSDLHTGMIHRFALDGKELGAFDHGVAGLRAAKLAAVPFNPANRPNIASDRFDSEKPDTWGFAPVARRVWGLAVHEDRLYYSVVSGPQIWSVGIERDGGFAADPRWELDVPAQAGPLPISDIAFSQQGAMILAQRALIAGAYDYSAFTRPGEPQVLRVWLKGPNDPPSPGRWKLTPEEYAVGFAGNNRNTNGGVALGYGYDQAGTSQPGSCEAALWTTGQNLRNNPALRSQLEPGGPLLVHGLQGAPADMVRNANTPPATSYFVDYDDTFDDASASGHMGSVRIFTQPCAGVVAVSSPTVVATPAGGGGGGGGGACYPANQPTGLSLPPLSLPPCTQPGQPVSLDLSTVATSPGFDPNWAVTPFGPQGHSTSFGPWTTLSNRWIQPKPSVVVQDHPVGTYVYTRKFNLTCRPESYRSLKLTGQYGSDNSSVVTLNGNILASCPNCYNTPPVTLTPPPASFFVPGLNVLTVTVKNLRPAGQGKNPTGMTMKAQLEAICGPDCICGCPPGSVVNKDGQCVPTTPIDLKIDKEDTPGGGGGHWFNVWVTNVGPPITFPAGAITVDEVVPAGMTVTGVTGTGWTCVPPTIVGPGTMHCTYNLAGSLGTGVALSSTMVVHYTTTGPGPFRNCAIVGIGSSVGVDTNPSNDKACADVTPTPGTLSVTKKVSPDPRGIGNTLTFPMTVTCTNPNASYPLNVHGNTSTVPFNVPVGSVCTVTETLPTLPKGCTWLAPIFSPASVTIASGLNIETVTNGYRCREQNGSLTFTKQVINHSPIPLPNMVFTVTVTCGGNVTTLNLVNGVPQTINNIPLNTSCSFTESIPWTANICPPKTTPNWNIGWTPPPPVTVTGSGITVAVQNTLDCRPDQVNTCPPPQVANVDGICVCPPPMVPGAVPGQCICPLPNVMIGGACVPPPPPVCPPPQVPNVDGICACPAPMLPGPVAGQCICPQGTVLTNGKCVTPPVRKQPDKVKKPQACPEGSVRQGGKCVKRERKQPSVTTDDVKRGIDIFRGIGGGGSGGGGTSSPGKR